MMRVDLNEDKLWRGRVYLKGNCEIPEDLAMAMGLSDGEPDPPSPLPPESATVAEIAAVPTPAKPKRRR